MSWARVQLFDRHLVGFDVFRRFDPEGLVVEHRRVWRCSWFDFLSARGRIARRSELSLGRIGGESDEALGR